MKVLFVALIFVAVAAAQHHNNEHHEDYYGHPKYEFAYGVKDEKTHDIKHHNEHRDGDKTEGEYSLVEPDGTTRTVKYHVDGKSGFIATVHRSGHAVHPQQVKHVAPIHHVPVVAQTYHQPIVHHQFQHHEPVVHHQVQHHQPIVHHQSNHYSDYHY